MELNFANMIKPELVILIPVCWGIGYLVRGMKCPNKFIPFINAVLSIALATVYMFATCEENIIMNLFVGFTQGLVCWLLGWITYDKFIKLGVETDIKCKLENNAVSADAKPDNTDETEKDNNNDDDNDIIDTI